MHPPVAANVKHSHAPPAQHAADQPSPVAVGGVLFTARYRNAATPHTVAEPVDTPLELARGGHPVVQHVAFGVVELTAVGSAAEDVAEEQILDSLVAQGSPERLLVEVHGVFAVRAGADVHHHCDPLVLQ